MGEKCERKWRCDAGGGLWFAGWLFTLGYVHLSFWQGVLGLILWPWYLGRFLAG